MVRLGRTGRFGRKGIAINFVHNRQSWQDIQVIEASIGKAITRVKTDDLDEMEEVGLARHLLCSGYTNFEIDIEESLQGELNAFCTLSRIVSIFTHLNS